MTQAVVPHFLARAHCRLPASSRRAVTVVWVKRTFRTMVWGLLGDEGYARVFYAIFILSMYEN